MGHRIAVLKGGRLQQLGTPLELYKCPPRARPSRTGCGLST
jgi:ABC-type sugar transport system ATPase subunit